jgi:hypothetical protein
MVDFVIVCDRCRKEGRYRYGDLDGLDYEDWALVWPDLVAPFKRVPNTNWATYVTPPPTEETVEVCAGCLTADETEQLREELDRAIEGCGYDDLEEAERWR